MDSTWTKEQVLGAVYASFQALGLEPTRDRAAITKAFRREAILWHPDKHPPERKPDCEARFKSLVNARDMCLEASEIELLMRDLESWDPKRQGVGGRGPTSAPRAPRPAPHPDRATGAPPRPSSSGRHTADSEWQVFVDQPSAYFDLFSFSASAFLVTGLVALLSMAITVTVIFVAIVVSLVVMIVSLILSALAISIPVIGWIGLAMAGFYLLAGILEVGSKASEMLRAFVGKELSKTAYPRKALRFTWWASNVAPVLLALPYLSEWLASFLFFYFLVSNACFWLLNESLGEILERVEAEYEAIRSRNTEAALVVRARERFGGSYSSGAGSQ